MEKGGFENDELKIKIAKLKKVLQEADTVLIGVGAGLSTSAGMLYSGEEFEKNYSDFIKKYKFRDLYTASFHDFKDQQEFWAFWSRLIHYERYTMPPKPVYQNLYSLIKNKNYFVITTNVDHFFQRTGFDKQKLFYTQGDYGLLQCKTPCHQKNYDNKDIIEKMFKEQKDMKIPENLIPHCPKCNGPMYPNLRGGDYFVEDEGWHKAADRYINFLEKNKDGKIVFLDLGSGMNTPGIFKFPFMKMTYNNKNATYVTINLEEILFKEIKDQSICIKKDIGEVLDLLLK